MKEQFTDGKTELEWVKAFFESSDLPKHISWEEFNKKGYYIINIKDDYKPTPSLRWFAEGRACAAAVDADLTGSTDLPAVVTPASMPLR